MRQVLPQILALLWFACALLLYPGAYSSQEPSAALKEADADYREGVAALDRNDLKTAEAKFQAVVRLAPSAEQGHSALGAVLVREGEWAAGTRELERALALKPNDSAAQLNLAMVYVDSRAPAKAVPLFAKLEASAKAENRALPATTLAAYARALLATGQIEAAIRPLRQAVSEQSGSPELHDELGALYAHKQDWTPAEEQFRAAIRLKDDFALAHLHLGFAFQAEQKPGSIDEWAKALQDAPDNFAVALAVGQALSNAGMDDRAQPVLEHAVQLDPKSTAAAYQLALVLQRVNRVPDAVALLKRVIEAEPQNADALINLGMALSQLHQATDGLPYLQRAVALTPGDATAHQDLAAAYIQINQVNDAIAQLKSALQLAPNSPQLHYDLGVAYKLQDDAADAIPELEAAQHLNPSGYEPAYVLGMLYMQVARYSEAAPQLENSVKLHPQNGEAWATLGNVYDKLNRLPEATAALREAIRQMPDQADSHLILATVLMKQNQQAEAAQERKLGADLMRAHMNLQRAQVATNTGKSFLASGKVDDAVSQFREALAFDPNYADAYEALADALDRQGKAVEAAAERAKAKALTQPSNTP